MARDVPDARGKSRLLRQGSTLLARCPRGVFPTHPVVYERGEDNREDRLGYKVSVAWGTFACEVAAVREVVGHRSERLEY